MPRERVDLVRESSTREPEKLFLLAYEGNETEPTYFEALKKDHRFNNDIIELVSLRREKRDTNSAPKHVFNHLHRIKEEYSLTPEDELWMIIDKDRNGKNIDKYYTKCVNEPNFFFALSSPCFELWLLLHITDLSQFSEDEIKKIIENKKIAGKNSKTFLKKLLSDLLPDGYNESKLRTGMFMPYIEQAIERAEAISDVHENYPTRLGTDIYKLVKRLIR